MAWSIADQNISLPGDEGEDGAVIDIVRKRPGVEDACQLHRRRQRNHQQRHDVRRAEAAQRAQAAAPTQVIGRLRPKLAPCPARRCSCKPVQDVRIGGRTSSAQYQYTLQGDDFNDLDALGAAASPASSSTLPGLTDVNSDQQDKGPAGKPDHRSRHRRAAGHHPAADRQHALRRLRPAAGLDDVHAAQPVPRRHGGAAGVLARPRRTPTRSIVTSPTGTQVPLNAVTQLHRRHDAAERQPPGQFPSVTISFNSRPASRSAHAVDAIAQAEAAWAAASASTAASPGTAQAYQASLANEPILILAALITVYIVLGISMRATSIRSRSSPRCPRPASARCWR